MSVKRKVTVAMGGKVSAQRVAIMAGQDTSDRGTAFCESHVTCATGSDEWQFVPRCDLQINGPRRPSRRQR
jgi:hypothetical protein